jgi:hypothetical protein
MDEKSDLERDRDEYRRRAMALGERLALEGLAMSDEEFHQVMQEIAFNMREAVLRSVEIVEQRKANSE